MKSPIEKNSVCAHHRKMWTQLNFPEMFHFNKKKVKAGWICYTHFYKHMYFTFKALLLITNCAYENSTKPFISFKIWPNPHDVFKFKNPLWSKFVEKMAFYYFNWSSLSSGVDSSKEKKIDTPKRLKNLENFSFKMLKTPQDFDSQFFDFSHFITSSSGCASWI